MRQDQKSDARTSGIIVAHDYLTQRGGAERVALTLASRFHADSLVTSVYNPDETFPEFADLPIQQSTSRVLQRFKNDPRKALPFLADIWDRFPTVDADVAICSSSGWAHALPVTPSTIKVVYCHNPARWLYQSKDYLVDASPVARLGLAALNGALKRWDARAARTADAYIANSSSVAERIRQAYGIEPEIVFPPVSIDPSGTQDPVPDLDPGFFLTVGRVRGYKGTGRLISAFAETPEKRLAIIGMAPDPALPENITALGRVTDDQLRWLYAHARALVSVSHEDFGLTPIEANAMGTPVLVLRAGGFLDSTDEGTSGSFIENESLDAIIDAVRSFRDDWDAALLRNHAEKFSPASFEARIRSVITSTRSR